MSSVMEIVKQYLSGKLDQRLSALPKFRIQYEPMRGWYIQERTGIVWVNKFGAYRSRRGAQKDLDRMLGHEVD